MFKIIKGRFDSSTVDLLGDIGSGAVFSGDEVYRYVLWRTWDKSLDAVRFVALNPSTADAHIDDPTIRRCKSFAARWGFGGLEMVNLFAYRATRPADLRAAGYPVGKNNDKWILGGNPSHSKQNVAKIVMCPGTTIEGDCRVKERYDEVLSVFDWACLDLSYIKRGKGGSPLHPLYLRSDMVLKPLNDW